MSSKGKNGGGNNKNKKNNQSVAIALPSGLSEEEMTEIIALAMVRAEEIKEENEIVRINESRKKLHLAFGCKKDEKPNIFHLLKLQFVKKEKIEGECFTIAMLKSVLSVAMLLASWLLFALFCTLVISLFIQIFTMGKSEMIANLGEFSTLIYTAFMSLVFAPIFRVISIEIEKMKNQNLFLSIFATFAAVATIIITLLK